jgi:non-specific serine/threonine protein kinase
MLTPRQREIAALVARGYTNKQIGTTLGLSRQTVETHVKQAAASVPGGGKPRHRLTLWFFDLSEPEERAA